MVGAEESRVPQLASGGALLPGTINLWLRWPEAGMLRTASHSANEAAERTVRPWTLDSSLLVGQNKKGESNLLCSISLPLFFLSCSSPLSFSPLSLFCAIASFYFCFNFFQTHSLHISMLPKVPTISPQTSTLALSLWPSPSPTLKFGDQLHEE